MATPICTRCKKRPAIVFVQQLDRSTGNVKNEGYCIACAKELGIAPVTDMLQKMGIDEEQFDQMARDMEEMLQNGDFSSLMNPFGDNDDDDADDADESDEADEKDEGRAPSINLGSIFGNLSNFRKESGEGEGDAKKTKKQKKSDKHRKNLEAFCQDLTRKAREGRIDKVIGRERELDRVVQILCRRQKNNPCLIGEPGVGKTAIAEALASKIALGDVPFKLRDYEVHLLDMTSLVAGTQFRGQFENRMKALIEEIKRLGNIILVIDEVHTIAGTGDAEGGMNAANILKPALSRGEVQIIGATTLSEYRKYIEKDSALERRFQPVVVAEPTVKETVEILKGIKTYYEDFHGIVIPDETVEKAVILSERYITDRFLPDKAIDLLDEASSFLTLNDKTVYECDFNKAKLDEAVRVRELIEAETPGDDEAAKADYFERMAAAKSEELKYKSIYEKFLEERKNVILTTAQLAKVIEIWTGVPASNINEDEFVRIDGLEARLKSRIVGQDKAVSAVTRAIKRSRAGIYTKRKPVSFIFAGPTGVGKTELVKTLSNDLFDSPEALIRLDMSEFMEKHAVSRIIGAPPGYVGYDEAGQLTEKIRRRPYSVVLFDEIEKAHPDVLNVLLQILDDGKVTDAHGKEVNFCNTVIVMTTNAGSQGTSNTAGFSKSENEANEEKTSKALSSFLRPEFMNRIDEIITFNSLSQEDFVRISKIMLGELQDSLKEKSISLEYTDDIPQLLAKKSFSVKYGARNLRRTIQTEIEDKASELIISSYNSKISGISIFAEGDEIKIAVAK